MTELSHANPTGRFNGLAELYARCRPGYPVESIDYIVKRCKLGRQTLVVDVGCGTGISSRILARRGFRVLGIEPNAEMRALAAAESLPDAAVAPRYCEGRAEATNLADATADAVLAAQAFHWFEPAAALAEFYSILKPDGWVILIWNERHAADAFTADYGQIVGGTPQAAAVELPRGRAGQPLLTSPLFQDAERVAFHYEQELDEDGVLGRAFSASYAPREAVQAAAFASALRSVFARHQRDNRVRLCYETSVYTARRRA